MFLHTSCEKDCPKVCWLDLIHQEHFNNVSESVRFVHLRKICHWGLNKVLGCTDFAMNSFAADHSKAVPRFSFR